MESWIIDVLEEIISRPAVNPANIRADEGVEKEIYGEERRADYIEDLVEEMGFDVVRYETVDDKGFVRPSLVVDAGGDGETVWIISHLDTVSPEGWGHDPFKLRLDGDKVYGLGVNDNGVGIVSSLVILKWISEGKLELEKNLKVGFLSDEEAGSEYGLKFLLDRGVFKQGERAIVPDFGNPNGSVIEIAEKGILWLKITTSGKQTHGSTPDRGDNAFLKASRLIVELYEKLHEEFPDEDPLFDPPTSTFEPTKKERNVDSINIIPGVDVHYWDCRILPSQDPNRVLELVEEIASKFDAKVEVVVREDSSHVDRDDWVVRELIGAIKTVLNIDAKVIGIGGGTFAGILRKAGVPSVVWQKGSETAHQPDEWELIKNYEDTARVIAKVLGEFK